MNWRDPFNGDICFHGLLVTWPLCCMNCFLDPVHACNTVLWYSATYFSYLSGGDQTFMTKTCRFEASQDLTEFYLSD